MADEPITVAGLARFHRDVFLPDVERVVTRVVSDLERRQNARFDDLYPRIDGLVTEYETIKAGPQRVEEGLGGIDTRLVDLEVEVRGLAAAQQKTALRSELQVLQDRVQELPLRIQEVEARLEG